MKLLVTGGTGFLGTHLVPRLVAAGHEVRIIGRSRPKGPGFETVEYVPGDLKDRDAVRRALEGVHALYHLAGLVSFQDKDARRMYELHVDATRELLHDVREAGLQRVILASTSGAIAVSKEERVGTEEDDYPIEVVGRWPYYLSKIYEEKLTLEYCRQHKIPLVVLNPSLLMGPGDDRLSSTWTVMKFLQGEIPAMPGGGISVVDVRDLADAFVNALTRGELYGRHLMGVNLSMWDFFQRLERLTGVSAPRLKLPPKVNVFGAKVLEQVAKWRGVKPTLDPQEVDIGEHWFWLDSGKAEHELGFRARDIHETLQDTVNYLYTRMAPGNLPGTKGRLANLREGT
ncbi:NAD-dependent epimerase/dehydratase family protein [Melittangium boletus]|uniref:Dihydroflavonol-4-reductase n=1 Tax=Melittangium boletus DSM 14713 TaxID=1294270 RepID=A0A250IKZ9_9BACT|nr:NAD-dependent epimerase/dehydratase family protein [Melittangium boletus]ATB31616.1 dihydroflavonol-4-reductase [Melittangium boletus DSM 14713]